MHDVVNVSVCKLVIITDILIKELSYRRHILKPSLPKCSDTFEQWKGRVEMELVELTTIHQADAAYRLLTRWDALGIEPVLVFDAPGQNTDGPKVCLGH